MSLVELTPSFPSFPTHGFTGKGGIQRGCGRGKRRDNTETMSPCHNGGATFAPIAPLEEGPRERDPD